MVTTTLILLQVVTIMALLYDCNDVTVTTYSNIITGYSNGVTVMMLL